MRAAILFLLTVALPVGLLSWAAVRSVERDRQLHAEQLEAGYRALAEERAATFNARLRAQLDGWLARVPAAGAVDVAAWRAAGDAAGRQLVLADRTGSLRYPAPPVAAVGRVEWPETLDDRVRGGGSDVDGDRELAPMAAFRGAAALAREGKAVAAVAAYERAAQAGAYPAYFRLAARLEAAALLRDLGRPDDAAAHALAVAEACLLRPEELPRPASADYLRARAAALHGGPIAPALAARRERAEALGRRVEAERRLRAAWPAARATQVAVANGGASPAFAALADGGLLLSRRGEAVVGVRVTHDQLEAAFGPAGRVWLVTAGSSGYERAFARAPVPLLSPHYAVAADPPDRASAEEALRSRIATQLALLGAAVLLAGLGAAFLARAYLRQRAASRSKSDFIARVSHELRTPLALIHGVAETLSLGRAEDPERKARYLATLLRESDALSRLVGGVLDFAAFERGELGAPAPVDLAELTRGVCDSVSDWAEADGFRVRCDAPDALELELDGDSVRLALLNLLSNAIKYSPDGGEVEVTLTAAGEGALLTVADRGAGLAPDEAARIFEPFVRGAAARPGVRGVGLGLALVREVAARHGGRIVARARPGGGTVFELTLLGGAR